MLLLKLSALEVLKLKMITLMMPMLNRLISPTYANPNNRYQCHFEESKAKVFINGSLDIGQDEDEIAEALMEHGPLAIALNAAWMQFYHGGVSHPLSYLCDPSGLGTFVMIFVLVVIFIDYSHNNIIYFIQSCAQGLHYGFDYD